MIESIVVWTIIAISAFFIARKFWRQWKAAASKKGAISCSCGCTCDGDSTCSPGTDGAQRKLATPSEKLSAK